MAYRKEGFMRITRNMMNMSSRRAKQPINQTSLLNSIAQSQPNSRLASLMKSSAAKRGFSPLKSTSYSGLEKSADSMKSAAASLLNEGEKGVFAKAKESGKTDEIASKVKSLVNGYNSTLKTMASDLSASKLGNFYYKQLKDVPASYKEALADVGITAGKDGSLTIDETKLESADLDALQKVFGPQGGFGKRVSYIGERIADYAQSNQQNVNSLYGSRGNAYSTLFGSRFNRRG